MKEWRTRHQGRHNSTINAETLSEVGDIVKAHLQGQSKSKYGIVKKLRYQAKGPFIVTKDLHHNVFEVNLYNRPNGDTWGLKTT